MNSKLKVYFYSPGFTSTRPVKEFAERDRVVFINPTPLYLDSYLKRTEPQLKELFEWTRIQYLPLTKEEFIAELDELEVDILALSVYTWNHTNVMHNLKDIHKYVKKPLKVIIGGPSVNVVRHDEYLLDLPEVDFAIYAQGETPFVSIIKHYAGIQKINVLNTKNLAWVENGRVRKADYEFVRVKSGSPIVESRDLLEQIVNSDSLKDWIIHFPYETSRGCPYNCSFCDWTSGLSHKVSKRKYMYEDELETLGELGIVNLYMADANFGLFPEDLQIAEAMAKLRAEKKYMFWIHGNNFSKTKKDQVFKIADIFVGSGIVPYMKFSIQDIHDDVLANIERPDIAWDLHVEYIMALRKKYPTVVIALDIIKGLPGQTRETWENLFNQICPHNLQMDVYDWEMISNSPAGYDKDYQQRMKLRTIKTVDVSDSGRVQEDIIETMSYSPKDYAYFTVIYQLYHIYFRNYVPAYPKFIKLVKASKHLDRYVDLVEANLTSKTKIRQIIKQMMQDLIKEYAAQLNKEFIKWTLNKLHRPAAAENLINNGMGVITVVPRETDDIILDVFKELD